MISIILSCNVKKMFKALKDIIEGKENALIEYFGMDHYKELLQDNGNNLKGATEWIKRILIHKIDYTEELLEYIANETKNNENVQKRLKAAKIT